MIHWLIHTDGGLLLRIVIGITIFALLAVNDLRRNGSAATRWREYGVLVASVAAALVYGALNDQITSRISWEYFYYAKELDKTLGPAIPPDMNALHWEAAKVGLKATWSAGILFGVAMLLANNPRRNLPRLGNRQLLIYLPLIFAVAAVCGAIVGFFGYEGRLNFLSADFVEMARADVFRTRRFMCTWGIHLGGYLGGFLGTLIAVVRILHLRRKPRH